MSVLPVVSPANTVAEHVDHHNAIHVLYNDLAGGANATASPDATGSAAIALGFNDSPVATGARAAGAYSISVGGANIGNAGASASADDSIAFGRGTVASIVQSISVGSFAAATTGAQAIAIGAGTNATAAPSATAQGAIAVGGSNGAGIAGAKASAIGAIAIGSGDAATAGAAASHANATAIGKGTATTAIDQVNIGSKRMFAGVPNSVAADANLINSQVSWFYDETADIMAYKAKNTAGTVKTGTALPARMGWHLTRVANQSVATATNTAISWDTEVQDTPNNFTAPGTTLTIPTAGDGLWMITFQANMGAAVDYNVAHAQIVAGGFTFQDTDHDDVGALQPQLMNVSVLVPLVATNTIVCNVRHQAAANQNYTGRITAYRVSF